MARTAYHYVKTLDFASDVALGMDSLSPKFVSSPLPKDPSRRLLIREDVAGKVFGQSMDTYGRAEVTLEHYRRRTQSTSNELHDFCCKQELKSPEGQISEPCIPPSGNNVNENLIYSNIDFGITSPTRVVSSTSIKDFNNNYDSNYEHSPLRSAPNGVSARSSGESEKSLKRKNVSPFINAEPAGFSEYSLLEKGVACFLKKKCRDEMVTRLSPLPSCSPDMMTGICKTELATSSNNDTGIGSLDDEDLTISDDSLDGKGIQYVSELKGTILRIRKLSKEVDQFKTTRTKADIEERMVDFEANVKYLKCQATDLKKRIKLRNRRLKNPYYWSRS